MRMPSRPSSASPLTISCGKRCSWSQRLACGLTSRSQNSRTAARNIWCCSGSSKSTGVTKCSPSASAWRAQQSLHGSQDALHALELLRLGNARRLAVGLAAQREQLVTYTDHGAALSADDPADQRQSFLVTGCKGDGVDSSVLQALGAIDFAQR